VYKQPRFSTTFLSRFIISARILAIALQHLSKQFGSTCQSPPCMDNFIVSTDSRSHVQIRIQGSVPLHLGRIIATLLFNTFVLDIGLSAPISILHQRCSKIESFSLVFFWVKLGYTKWDWGIKMVGKILFAHIDLLFVGTHYTWFLELAVPHGMRPAIFVHHLSLQLTCTCCFLYFTSCLCFPEKGACFDVLGLDLMSGDGSNIKSHIPH